MNVGDEYRSLISKNGIKKHEHVTIKETNFKTFKVVNYTGQTMTCTIEDLAGYGFDINTKACIDLDESDPKCIKGFSHLTKNVRGVIMCTLELHRDFLYLRKIHQSVQYFNYQFREIDDTEAVSILLNEIVYGLFPGLMNTTLLGSVKPGIDMDPNTRHGTYLLPNSKTYKISINKKVIIKKESDVIFNEDVDWDRMKLAFIKRDALNLLKSGTTLIEKHPEVLSILMDDIDTKKYRLNNEY